MKTLHVHMVGEEMPACPFCSTRTDFPGGFDPNKKGPQKVKCKGCKKTFNQEQEKER